MGIIRFWNNICSEKHIVDKLFDRKRSRKVFLRLKHVFSFSYHFTQTMNSTGIIRDESLGYLLGESTDTCNRPIIKLGPRLFAFRPSWKSEPQYGEILFAGERSSLWNYLTYIEILLLFFIFCCFFLFI